MAETDNIVILHDEGNVDPPLRPDEILTTPDGTPLTQSEVWNVASQKGEQGMVLGADGNLVRKSQALRMAMEKDMETLAKQIEAGYTEQTLEFLAFSSRMHRYSSGNQDLIYMQRRDASFVQGFTKWQNAGYVLRKGAKGIAILQPKPFMTIERKNEGGSIVEKEKKAIFFNVAYVFDIKDIDPDYKKPPEIFTPLKGEADLLTARLVEVLAAEGIPVYWRYPLHMHAEGSSGSYGISIRPDLTSVNKFVTLVHEAVHSKLHHTKEAEGLSKQEKECQAEVTSFLVSSHFGIMNPLSSDYLRGYGVNKDVLKANLKITQQIANHLITKMEEGYNDELMAQFEYDPSLEGQRKPYKPRGKTHRGKRRS